MLTNFHTHTTFCDGDNTAEEIVLTAIEKGFSAIGFSGHGYSDFDLSFCIKDTDGYITEINRLKDKYKNDIQIYLGLEEDSFAPCDRSKFDYIIGSSHYFKIKNEYYPIDLDYDGLKKCIKLFDYDILRLAETYYSVFCDYISHRKPDIIGHFDLITKFDELDVPLFLNNNDYHRIADRYIAQAAKSECIFEVNTGGMARGYRTSPYPNENLLHTLKRLDAKVILSSDCHKADALDFGFKEAKKQLRDIGFKSLYTINNGEFVKYDI